MSGYDFVDFIARYTAWVKAMDETKSRHENAAFKEFMQSDEGREYAYEANWS